MSEQAEVDILLTNEWLTAFKTRRDLIAEAQRECAEFRQVMIAEAEAEIKRLYKEAGFVEVHDVDAEGNHVTHLAYRGTAHTMRDPWIHPAVLSDETIQKIAERSAETTLRRFEERKAAEDAAGKKRA